METVTRGGAVRLSFALYAPGTTALTDPDEYPAAPRFFVATAAAPTVAIAGFEEIPFADRQAKGVYDFVLPITTKDNPGLEDGSYVVKLTRGTTATAALVDLSGSVPTESFVIFPPAVTPETWSPYATGLELFRDWGLKDVSEPEIRFAQRLADDYMHRSLWIVPVKERVRLAPRRNSFLLSTRPIVEIFGAEAGKPEISSGALGRVGYGRRHAIEEYTLYDFRAHQSILGLPPPFRAIPGDQVDVNPRTGECWLPSSLNGINGLSSYTEVEFHYLTGLQEIPNNVKGALSETIDWIRFKGYANLTSYSASKVSKTMGTDFLPTSVKTTLDPYRVNTWR